MGLADISMDIIIFLFILAAGLFFMILGVRYRQRTFIATGTVFLVIFAFMVYAVFFYE